MIIRIFCLMLTLALVGCDRQDADWEQAQQEDTLTAYNEFVERYPESPEADQARSRIAALRTEQAWSDAGRRNTIEAYREFIQAHPDHSAADEARDRLETLEREAAWQSLADSGDAAALRRFAADHSDSREAELARARIGELEAQAEAQQRQRELELQRERERQARLEAEQGTHRVQLAVLRGQNQANQGVEMLEKRLAEVLGDVSLEVQQTNGLYRLVTQTMSQDQANDLCATLKQRGQDCLVRQR